MAARALPLVGRDEEFGVLAGVLDAPVMVVARLWCGVAGVADSGGGVGDAGRVRGVASAVAAGGGPGSGAAQQPIRSCVPVAPAGKQA